MYAYIAQGVHLGFNRRMYSLLGQPGNREDAASSAEHSNGCQHGAVLEEVEKDGCDLANGADLEGATPHAEMECTRGEDTINISEMNYGNHMKKTITLTG